MSQVDHHQSGVGYWRSLEQMADSPEVRDLIAQEFAGYDPASIAGPSRRRFLKLMAASMAMAGLTLTGCRRWPQEKLAPYTSNPEGRIPGAPEQYATAWEVAGVAQGLLITSYDGRPIKIEGNPSHPFSVTIKDKQGATDAFAQASILEMYDPERSRDVVDRTNAARGDSAGRSELSDWKKFAAAAKAEFAKYKGNGQGFVVLSEATNSPSVLAMKDRLMVAFPQAKWVEYEPLTWDAELEGSIAAFGKPLRSRLHLNKAKVVVSLDSDFLSTHPAHVRYAADWAEMRRGGDNGEMNRVYMAESSFSLTGSVADWRLPVEPDRIATIARAIAFNLGVQGINGTILNDSERKFADAAAAELKAAGANGVITVGASVPAGVHALAHAINQQIGALGKTVTFIDDPAGKRATHMTAIADLARQMTDGKVSTLLILGGNPAYDAPIDAEFPAALEKVPMTIRLGLYDDETSKLCKWHLPRAHYLESWGDARAWDGAATIAQPLIEPLYGGKSVIELLAILAGDPLTAGDQIVRRTAREKFIKTGEFELAFKKALEAGVLPNSASPDVIPTVTLKEFPAPETASPPSGAFFLKFEPDSHTYDGRYANSGWLQETHDPITKLVWDNAALISVKDANRLGITTGDVIQLDCNNRWMKVAAYVLPGQPIGVIGLSVGYGRRDAGSIGTKLGFNAYGIRTSTTPYIVRGVKLTKTSDTYTLALTTLHHIIDETGMKGRAERVGAKGDSGVIVREATLEEFKKNKNAPHEGFERPNRLQLFDSLKYPGPHAWGMTVDLNTCIGCNACVVACQAENNVGVVGKDQVLMHREMGWIRIDRYFKPKDGDLKAEDPDVDIIHQPMMCQHCENAPCEQVCPVAATMHDTEGLNVMVYNRCIGTRYCSNNCPYKVRRFNYFDWHAKPPRKSTGVTYLGMPDLQQVEQVDKIRQMQFNPEVTVRMRGVMEKCTYCIQRISKIKIAKRNVGEDVKDGDILTACQQVCPTQAIVFGNIAEKDAKVVELQKNSRAYEVLGDLNPRPRTKYLAKLRNPAESAGHSGSEHSKEAAIQSLTETVG